MSDLFESKGPAPLADRMRPQTLEEYVGQEEVVKAVTKLAARPPSMILWGPPGCGKTTLARLIAAKTSLHFQQFSAVTSGIKEVKEAIDQARWRRSSEKKGTLLFVDEIHRFNRAQQDAFLPHIEDGTVVLIGATTENPSFEVNAPLLSRCRVFTLQPHTSEHVLAILKRAAEREKVKAEEGALEAVATLAGGDARAALNLLEMCGKKVTAKGVQELAQRRVLLYDKDRDQHFDTVSALIKSMRGSDVDAALYWLARMLEAGEDPLFVARRLVIFASEDVGNADPRGIMVAVAAKEAVHFIGMPEGFYPLAQATVYLATAPKSNAAGEAYKAAKGDVEKLPNEPVPLHLRNAVTGLMKASGYGKGYEYAHDQPGAVVSHGHRPPNVEGHAYYLPTDRGYEASIKKLMEERKKRH
ncbi:MAG TPA: replication-associated recombination protein A [Planctomycetota bacterium]|nr:replication-associated recombination protein A [Planctomycetota bacterium]